MDQLLRNIGLSPDPANPYAPGGPSMGEIILAGLGEAGKNLPPASTWGGRFANTLVGGGSGIANFLRQEAARRRLDPLTRQMAVQRADVETLLRSGTGEPAQVPSPYWPSPVQEQTLGPGLPSPTIGQAARPAAPFPRTPETVAAGLRQGLGWQAFGIETPLQRTQRESAEIQRQTNELQLTEARQQVAREQQFRAGLMGLDPYSKTYVRDLIGLQQRTGVGPSSEIVRNAQSALNSEELNQYRDALNEIREENRKLRREAQEDQVIPLAQFKELAAQMEGTGQTLLNQKVQLPDGKIVRMSTKEQNLAQAYLEASMIPDPKLAKVAMDQIGAAIGARATAKFGQASPTAGPSLPAPTPGQTGGPRQGRMTDAEILAEAERLIELEKRKKAAAMRP